jgi:LPXTG-motif cell wall-anchored protein
MIRKTSSLIIAVALFAVAGLSLAQNADKNSAGPTKNDLKIRVVEPLEGATITGTSARVSVDYDRSRYREQGNTDKGLDKFPPPTFVVYLDNDLKQTLKTGDTVATIDNIPPGSHRIVIMAKNISGEVIDRKEINITAVTAPAVASISSSTTERTTVEMPAPAPAYQPPPAPAASYQPAPAPAPIQTATTLPKTASSAPQLALLGLALVAGGLLVGRKGR